MSFKFCTCNAEISVSGEDVCHFTLKILSQDFKVTLECYNTKQYLFF